MGQSYSEDYCGLKGQFSNLTRGSASNNNDLELARTGAAARLSRFLWFSIAVPLE